MSSLVIIGASQIMGDLLDAAYLAGRPVRAVLLDGPELLNPRDTPLRERLVPFEAWGVCPEVRLMEAFEPRDEDEFLLGPTSPGKRNLLERFIKRFPDTESRFTRLIHPSAVVSPTAEIGQGCFVGALSVLASRVRLDAHVFINRQVGIGHDSVVGPYSRLQPGARLAGLIHLGAGVTVGLGAAVLERLHIGDGVEIAANALVTRDLAPGTRFVGRAGRSPVSPIAAESELNGPNGGSSVGA